jgi:hypothetical protein
MASENEELRAEIELLKDTLSELITEHNLMTGYIQRFRDAHNSVLRMRWYRFVMWLRPFPLPMYERRIIVNRFRKRDRRPVLRSGDGRGDRAPRTRKPRPVEPLDVSGLG